MRTVLTLAMAMALTIVQAQLSSLRPSELVSAQKNNRAKFATYQLFDQAPALRDGDAVNAKWLSLRSKDLRGLLQAQPKAMTLPIPAGDAGTYELELVQVNLFADDFSVVLASNPKVMHEIADGMHYRGIIKGQPESVVAISVFDDEISGVISTPEHGNQVLGRYKSDDSRLHILHEDSKMADHPEFHCQTADSGRGYSAEELREAPELRGAASCVRVYLEVDNDVFRDKGGQDGTVQYITSVFNQVATLYANDNISLTLSQVFVWNTTSPYTSSDTYTLLTQFQRTRSTFNGDAGMLLSYRGNGGIAVVDGLCRPYTSFKMGYSGIGKTFSNVPTFSFTVMVVAHELGHILGSQHTHACVWNGNNTALDACPGFTEGNCAASVTAPTGGGTIMSYCHLNRVGINFTLGFGQQPGTLMRNKIASASCLQACPAGGGGTGTGTGGGTGTGTGGGNAATCGNVTFSLTLDLFGSETTWEILNPAGVAVEKGGPYVDKTAGQKVEKKVCLPYGCYRLRILDKIGDGICCNYGSGSFKLLDANNIVIAQGGQFSKESLTNFCVQAPGGSNPPPVNTTCTNIDFSKTPPVSFGGSQDGGTATVSDAGKTLVIRNNAWKAVPLAYTLTSNTYIEFEFRSTQQGEIHGIGFDDDENISAPYTFQVWGKQSWGISNYRNYEGNGAWKKYTIKVGQFYTGATKYLFFACDMDAAPYNGESQFRNVRIYESTPCPTFQQPNTEGLGFENNSLNEKPAVVIYPNPTYPNTKPQVNLSSWPAGQYKLEVFDLYGKSIRKQNLNVASYGEHQFDLDTAELPAGTYLYKVGDDNFKLSGRVVVMSSN